MPLRDGAIGELVLPAQAVQDKDWLTPLRAERAVEIVPAGSTLLLAMRLSKAPEALHGRFLRPDADRLRKNPLGVYVHSINWSKELG